MSKFGIQLVAVDDNLVDLAWENKAPQPCNKVFLHEEQWNHYPTQKKLDELMEDITKMQASGIVVSQLDEIAWVLNLRGSDIDYNPLFKSYLFAYIIESEDKTQQALSFTLYINEKKLTEQVTDYIKKLNGRIKPYESVFEDLSQFNGKVILNIEGSNCKIAQSINPLQSVKVTQSQLALRKSVKTSREIQGMRECHIRDAVAVISFLAFLEDGLVHQKNLVMNEYEGAMWIDKKRKTLKNSMGISFETISCIGENAAIIHYTPKKEASAQLVADKIYLLDSGGQYLDGTTDITRTVHFGQPTKEEKDAYTKVLLGNLDLQRINWFKPWRINGSDLDVIARKHLWTALMNYNHGTGHGVGYFLNVHEHPNGIGKGYNDPLVPGNVLTDEPGYYLENHFGIRIEDQLLVVEKNDSFYGFENLTMVPYDRNLIDFNQLTQEYIDYINNYHKKVWELVSPLLIEEKDQLGLDWLKRNTAEIKK